MSVVQVCLYIHLTCFDRCMVKGGLKLVLRSLDSVGFGCVLDKLVKLEGLKDM